VTSRAGGSAKNACEQAHPICVGVAGSPCVHSHTDGYRALLGTGPNWLIGYKEACVL